MQKNIISGIIFMIFTSSLMAEPTNEDLESSAMEYEKANIAMMKKDSDSAYSHLKKAIELDPTNSAFLNSTAYMAMQMNEPLNALKYLKVALDIDKEKYGDSHPNLASVINNIASVYSKVGNHEKAIENYQLAYDMIVSELGENHPQVDVIKRLLEAEKKNSKEN